MKTRKQYLNGKCSHQEYYAQFVTDALKEYVKKAIGEDKIKKSKDPAFNDIPLKRWDAISQGCNNFAQKVFEPVGDYPTLASGVCIAKEAARQIKNT